MLDSPAAGNVFIETVLKSIAISAFVVKQPSLLLLVIARLVPFTAGTWILRILSGSASFELNCIR